MRLLMLERDRGARLQPCEHLVRDESKQWPSALTHALSLIRLTHVGADGLETALRVCDDGDGDRDRQ